MSAHLSNADSPDEEVIRAYESNAAPFASLEQVDRFIRAAGILRQRLPADTEHAGHRTSLRDVMDELSEAKRWRSMYLRGRRGVNRCASFGGLA